MKFLDRIDEMGRLDDFLEGEGVLTVIWGRRRIGKTRLLLEWVKKRGGFYWVADQSSGEVQRSYLAQSLDVIFPGIAGPSYPDWDSLLKAIVQYAQLNKWTGPLVLDEFPYLVLSSKALESIFQRWVDHDAREAGIKVVLVGSSQSMMQGMVLDSTAPLYGRASQLFGLKPVPAGYIGEAFNIKDARLLVSMYALWGGVPRYWELASRYKGQYAKAAVDLILNPSGPLHREIDRLLVEEIPSAINLRPILDAIGMGAGRVSEIAGKMGAPATSLIRPIQRLMDLGYVTREVPFGEDEKNSKKSIYRLSDPFFRFWFQVVAPRRGHLVESTDTIRGAILEKYFHRIVSESWEDLVRRSVPLLNLNDVCWGPARRYWHKNQSEWDGISLDIDEKQLLFVEAKWPRDNVTVEYAEKVVQELLSKEIPSARVFSGKKRAFAVFLPEVPAKMIKLYPDIIFVDARRVLSVLK